MFYILDLRSSSSHSYSFADFLSYYYMSSVTSLRKKTYKNQKSVWLQTLTELLEENLFVRLIFDSELPTVFTLDTSEVTELLRASTEI